MPDSTRDEITTVVRDYIDNEMQYMASQPSYENTDNLHDVCALDELDILEILMHLEEELSLPEIPDGDYVTVNDFVDAAMALS